VSGFVDEIQSTPGSGTQLSLFFFTDGCDSATAIYSDI
jgi:hypothetical protein